MRKRIIAVITAAVAASALALCLAGCGGSSTAAECGTYNGTTAETYGQEYDIAEIFPDGDNVIELKADNAVDWTLDGDTISGTYTLDGENLTVTVSDDGKSVDSVGTLKDGTIVIDILGAGLDATFVKAE